MKLVRGCRHDFGPPHNLNGLRGYCVRTCDACEGQRRFALAPCLAPLHWQRITVTSAYGAETEVYDIDAAKACTACIDGSGYVLKAELPACCCVVKGEKCSGCANARRNEHGALHHVCLAERFATVTADDIAFSERAPRAGGSRADFASSINAEPNGDRAR